MASYGKFQSDNSKHTMKSSRVNKFNAGFAPQIAIIGNRESKSLIANLEKWGEVIAWCRWNADVWYDLITPETGGIRLDLDQRVFLRCITRFPKGYYTFSRGYSKTLLNMMGLIHTAIFFPNVKLAVTAQTRENSAKIMKEKYDELIRFYPLLKEEIYSTKFRNDTAEIQFHNGSVIDNLANHQSSKGARRHQGSSEEDNIMNEEVFLDAIEPIFNVPRRTIGKIGLIDPHEMNGAIRAYTSTGHRGSPAYFRCLKTYKNMIELKGAIFLGAGWQLGAFYGRGESVSAIMAKKENNTPTSFDMNYLARWTGASTDGFVNPTKLLDCRTLSKTENKCLDGCEYVLGIDIARSSDSSNNQTSIAVLKIVRAKNGKIKSINLVNLITISGMFNNTAQSIEIKKIKERYKASILVVDSNGMGVFAIDSLCETQIDPSTGLSLVGLDTIVDDSRVSDTPNAEKCIYPLFAQSCQNEIVTGFMDVVNSSQLRLLEKKTNADYDMQDTENYVNNILPYIQTDFLIDEILNLKAKKLSNGSYTLEKFVKKMDKDRVSSVIYGVWYIKKFMDNFYETDDRSNEEYLLSYLNY